MNGGGKTPPSIQATFEDALAKLPDGYVDGYFGKRSWGVTVKRSQDGKRTWLYGEELSGSGIVSFNLYELAASGSILKPCEMSSSKVIEFVLGFEPSTKKAATHHNGQKSRQDRHRIAASAWLHCDLSAGGRGGL